MSKSVEIKTDKPRRLPRGTNANIGPSAGLKAAKQSMKLRTGKIAISESVRDDYAAAQNAKNDVRGSTGLIYDKSMVNHYCLWDPNYPECPERFSSIINRCNELNLINRCIELPPREATEAEIRTKHTQEQIDLLKSTQEQQNDDLLEEISSKYDAIYINRETYRLSLLATGCAIDLVDAICNGRLQNGMAIIRPPGHHAMKSEYCGYCFFNNVAIAANHAIVNNNIKRILIVDWDVHHGQATQQMFYDDPRVVYFSIHRYEHGKFWPELRESNYDYIGEGSGKGYNFNVPLNSTGMKDADYLAIFQQILLPMAYEYQPELVIVSAGYDAAIGCPEGEMEVSPACYAHLLSSLLPLARGKVAVVLEGGYCLKSLSEGAALTLRCLLGDPVPSLLDLTTPTESIVETILNVIYVHKPYWQCYQLQDVYYTDKEMNVKTRKKSSEMNNMLKESTRHMPTLFYMGNEIKPDKYATRNCYPVQSQEFLKQVSDKLDHLKLTTNLYVPGNRVALVYDSLMLEHASLSENNHPEKPERISGVYDKLSEYDLLGRCFRIEPREATEEELLLVHTKQHLEEMKETSELTKEELVKKGDGYDSIYFHPKTYHCALLAAGSLLQVVDSVVSGQSRSGVAVVRPPGHHAEDDNPSGFCIFNNVSLAAKYAVEFHSLKRVLLLDWDVHHGNGSQRMFESDDRVLYISLHRYNNGRFFPSSTDADYDKVGTGRGLGFNVNIPWNKNGGGMTDGDYISAFHSVVLPIAYQFNPELVLVSAGFDACINDPLGHCKVSPEAYAHMTHWLTSLANGRVILALEGGYNVTSVSYALTLCTKSLLGDPLPPLTGTNTPCASAVDTIKNVLRTQEKYWTCLKLNRSLPKENVLASEWGRKLGKGEKEDEAELQHNTAGDCFTKGEKDLANMSKMLSGLTVSDQAPLQDGGNTPYPPPEPRGGGADGRRDEERGHSSSSSAAPQSLHEFLRDHVRELINEEMFAVVPLRTCPHLNQVQPLPETGIDHRTPCSSCGSTEENWICLICYSVHCGRYINQHMLHHAEELEHPLALSFSDLSVWCYPCEAYVDNKILYPSKNALHQSKFNSPLQWIYGDTPAPTSSSNTR